MAKFIALIRASWGSFGLFFWLLRLKSKIENSHFFTKKIT